MPSTKKLHELNFPAYKMGSYHNIEDKALGKRIITTEKNVYVLDDTSLPGDYFDRRIRIKLYQKEKEMKLYPLNKLLRTFSEILKYPSNSKFIDRSGYIFNYVKGINFYKVECHKITKRIFDPSRGTMLFSDDINCPIFHTDRVHGSIKYMGLLNIDGGYLLYNLTSEPFNEARRKI